MSWSSRRTALALAATCALFAAACRRPPAEAASTDPLLPPGPGRQAFVDGCQMCHTTRYVLDQPRFPRKTWTAEVEKMRTAYGAPIASASVPPIVDYLVSLNGTE